MAIPPLIPSFECVGEPFRFCSQVLQNSKHEQALNAPDIDKLERVILMTQTDDYIPISESVSCGHPDKVADPDPDALVDAGLSNGDETTRVAVETLVTTNYVTVAGEVKNFNVDNVEEIVRNKVKEIGYEQDGFHWKKFEFVNKLHSQSGDIGLGTDDFGAGDQGMMFGYACNENEAYMPAPIYLSHKILEKLKEIRLSGYEYMLPDAKAQVSVEYRGNRVERVDQVVVSHQHTDGFQHSIKMPVRRAVEEVCGGIIDDKTIWHINPTGKFVIGGPDGDTGITGRKLWDNRFCSGGVLAVKIPKSRSWRHTWHVG